MISMTFCLTSYLNLNSKRDLDMKKLLVEPQKWGRVFDVDFDNQTVDPIINVRCAVDKVYLVKENEQVIIKNRDGSTTETTVEPGDILVTFYEDDFPHRFIVVKSKEWAENIKTYESRAQERIANAKEAQSVEEDI